MKVKPKIFIVGSCVSRDVFELTDKYEIVEYVGRTSLASAFSEKSFFGPSDNLLEEKIESKWQRKCVRYDTRKLLPDLLKKKQYDAIVLDYVEERFKLLQHNQALATLSGELKLTELHKIYGIKSFRPLNFKRKTWWISSINELVDIAKSKNIPVFLNEVYPAYYNELGWRHPWFRTYRRRFYLNWFYNHTPDYVQRFKVPKKLFIADSNHRLGGRNPFHYIPAVYECLLKQLELQLD